MTAQDTTNVETPESVVEDPSKKKFSLKPIAKKVLIWGGAAIGLIAVTVLATAAVRGDECEEDSYELETPDDNIEITSFETTELTD